MTDKERNELWDTMTFGDLYWFVERLDRWCKSFDKHGYPWDNPGLSQELKDALEKKKGGAP
jgi:hypothetical protein